MKSKLDVADFPLAAEPELALVKLRRELESRMRNLHALILGEPRPAVMQSTLLKDLAGKGIITQDLESAIRNISELANPAAHGRKVDPSDAARTIDLGLSVIDILDRLTDQAEAVKRA